MILITNSQLYTLDTSGQMTFIATFFKFLFQRHWLVSVIPHLTVLYDASHLQLVAHTFVSTLTSLYSRTGSSL